MIGEKIRILRERKKYSQEDLAEMLNVHNVTVSKWENGKMEPRMSKIKKMAKIFNVNISDLIDNNENEEDNTSRLLNMVQQASNSDIPPDKPFTAGINKNTGTMTYSNGEQTITVPYSEKLFAQIFQAMMNNNSQPINSNNNFSITGTGNSGKQIIGNKGDK